MVAGPTSSFFKFSLSFYCLHFFSIKIVEDKSIILLNSFIILFMHLTTILSAAEVANILKIIEFISEIHG